MFTKLYINVDVMSINDVLYYEVFSFHSFQTIKILNLVRWTIFKRDKSQIEEIIRNWSL